MKAQASVSQRSGHVPLSVCQNLEQCIRSTEVCSTKWMNG